MFDICGALCGGLEEWYAQAVREFLKSSLDSILSSIVRKTNLCNSVLDNFLIRHIGLVADQELVDTLGGISVDLLQPLLHVVERIHVGDIVDHTDTMSAAVVRRCDCAEALLTSGIPLFGCQYRMIYARLGVAHNLQLNSLAVKFDSSDFLLRISSPYFYRQQPA